MPTTETHDTTVFVIKRNGDRVPLDITKIKDVIAWACKGKKVQPVELEAKFALRLTDGIATRDIQESIIECAASMANIEAPDWRYVAGRLKMWGIWKDTLVSREASQYFNGNFNGQLDPYYASSAKIPFSEIVKKKVKAGIYDPRILIYSPQSLDIAYQWIRKEWDEDYDYAGSLHLANRYLQKDELPQEAFLLCALLIASPEMNPEYHLEESPVAIHSAVMQRAKQYYEAIASRKISLATPLLSHLRTARKQSLTSCFITAADDSLDSIMHEADNLSRISKGGGGAGINISRIRGVGSWVMGTAKASKGIPSWLPIFNAIALAVNQGKQVCPVF